MTDNARPSRRAFLGLAGTAAAAAAFGGPLLRAAPAQAATVRISWLGDVLRAAGCTVIEEGDWLDRGRPGEFNPSGVLLHHTAIGTDATTSKPAPALNTVINGRPDLSGPLCHILLDYNGACHLISANRANHAGVANASGPMPAGDGNTLYIGIEIDYNATGVDTGQAPSDAQREQAVVASAALCAQLGVDGSHVRAHRETSQTGKIDPSYFNMTSVRSAVDARLG